MFTFSSISTVLQRFAKTNLAADGVLSSASEVRITISVIYSAAMLVFLGGVFIAIRKAGMRAFILRIMQINPQSESKRPYRLLIINTLITSLLAAAYVVRIFDPRLDPLMRRERLFREPNGDRTWSLALHVRR
ncbi:MAG: hypothetical protein IIC78_13390 [Chloroflexi bacterium]|nr:hypothetical protein [Chloroflexota bacterium]